MSEITPSPHPGMGAIPHAHRTSFRVWAPHATQVYVMGSFNRWSRRSQPLANEGNGCWSVDAPGVQAGDEYQFVIVNGAQEFERIDPYARAVTGSVGNAIVHDPAFDWEPGDYKTPGWNEMVIYEMHIGTFNDRPGGSPGNFNGVIRKLPYLQDLGINVIQIMPSMEFAGGFSWGYNPSYIFAIERDYGGPDAFKHLIKAARAHGIAVIFDAVYNHFGPTDLGLWQFDGWSENGKGGIYFYNDWRSSTPWGETRPDYGRGEVRQYIRDNALSWLGEYWIDGLRWDSTIYLRNVYGYNNDPDHDIPEAWSLMQWVNSEAKARFPWKIMIAEDLQGNAALTADVSQGGAGFDAQWDARFVHPIRQALIAVNDEARSMEAVRDAIGFRYNDDAFERVIYTESHDEVANGKARLPEEIWPGNAGSWFSKKRSTLGAALVFTTPGIPMIFQGQEFLEDKWFHDQDPLDWSKRETYRGILHMYRDLIRLRRNATGKTRGLCGQHVDVFYLHDHDKVLAFHRWDRGGPRDSVVVVTNFANRRYQNYRLNFPRQGVWRARFNSDWARYDPESGSAAHGNAVQARDAGDGMTFYGELDIGPYSAIILSQDE
ncbi:MAG TPA: alpha-amylase family glycosyl hydrolase [Anaerolineae bacterium]